jgi:tyrosyl-tRNA synthetase
MCASAAVKKPTRRHILPELIDYGEKMVKNIFDILNERGYIEQCTHEAEIKELLGREKVTFYVGFDPTADSLHIGHFIQIMVMTHMQRAGHRPIALLGGGTTMVGDPTGKTDIRKMLTQEQIQANADNFMKVFRRFLTFDDDRAVMVNNADWLLHVNYIDFLREVGVHFSVNRMLTADCYQSRMERGLTFLEFNYMLMQSYDFLMLNEKYGCKMQFGGNDQWSNIIGGVELIRKKTGNEAYGMTFKLLVNSEGKKMGKTEKGALWLDPEKTPPYEFYQYFRNVDDADVKNCLSLLTFLPMDEIEALTAHKDERINAAKERLAYEVTKLIHGQEEAEKAQTAARALFSDGVSDENMPSTGLSAERVGKASISLRCLSLAG